MEVSDGDPTPAPARYPRHPQFGREARARDLEQVAGWVVKAAVTHEPVSLRGAQMNAVEAYAVPLEMAHASAASLTPRTDGRFLRAVKAWADERPDGFSLDALYGFLADEGKAGFGLNEDGCAFFAWYLLHAEGYEARRRGKVVTLERFRHLDRALTLRKGRVVDSATWDKACAAALGLLGVRAPGELPSVPNQAKLDADVALAIASNRADVKQLRDAIAEVCDWAGVEPASSARVKTLDGIDETLAGLTDGGDAFERVQALAALRDSTRYATFMTVLARPRGAVRPLLAERTAVADIGHAQLAFRAVEHQGDESQKAAVVTALRNLLRDPVSRALAEHGARWVQTANEVGNALATRPAPAAKAPTPAVKSPVKAPGGWSKSGTVSRAELATLLQKASAAALMQVDSERVVFELVVRPAEGARGEGEA